jgi:CheY-like chemotaxis protein
MNESNGTLSIFQSNDELFESMNSRIPDLIVCQLSTPKINALKVMSAVRSFPVEERPKMIVIGRRQNKANKALIMQVGVEEYIEMPTTYLRVQSTIQECLKRIKARKQTVVEDESTDNVKSELAKLNVKPERVTKTRSIGMWADEVYVQQKPANKLRPKNFKYPWQKSAEERKKEIDDQSTEEAPKKRLELREEAPPEKEVEEKVQVDELIETQFKENEENEKVDEVETVGDDIAAESEPLAVEEIEKFNTKLSLKERLAKAKESNVEKEEDFSSALDDTYQSSLADIELSVILGGVDRMIRGEDPYEILVNFVEQIDEVMASTSCSFFILVDDKLEKIANYDLELNQVESIIDIEGADHVLENSSPYVREYSEKSGLPVMTHPVYCGNEIIGFFHSRRSIEDGFTEDEIKRLENIIDGLNGIIVRYYELQTMKRVANE